MAVDVVTSVVIRRPKDEVANYSASPDNVPAWYVNIKSVEWKTPRPAAVGSRVAFVAQFLGRRLAYTYEIIEWIPGERFVMRTAEGPFPMETTYAWSTVPDGGTLMTLRNRGTPKGFSRLVAPFMARAVKKANQEDLARLKRLLEAGRRQVTECPRSRVIRVLRISVGAIARRPSSSAANAPLSTLWSHGESIVAHTT